VSVSNERSSVTLFSPGASSSSSFEQRAILKTSVFFDFEVSDVSLLVCGFDTHPRSVSLAGSSERTQQVKGLRGDLGV
jgi:hypothetical protein